VAWPRDSAHGGVSAGPGEDSGAGVIRPVRDDASGLERCAVMR
jgi:hypothetical protein